MDNDGFTLHCMDRKVLSLSYVEKLQLEQFQLARLVFYPRNFDRAVLSKVKGNIATAETSQIITSFGYYNFNL